MGLFDWLGFSTKEQTEEQKLQTDQAAYEAQKLSLFSTITLLSDNPDLLPSRNAEGQLAFGFGKVVSALGTAVLHPVVAYNAASSVPYYNEEFKRARAVFSGKETYDKSKPLFFERQRHC
jgi:hypothetical protein